MTNAIPTSLQLKFPSLTMALISTMTVCVRPSAGISGSSVYEKASKEALDALDQRHASAQLGTMVAGVSVEDADWLVSQGAKAVGSHAEVTMAARREYDQWLKERHSESPSI